MVRRAERPGLPHFTGRLFDVWSAHGHHLTLRSLLALEGMAASAFYSETSEPSLNEKSGRRRTSGVFAVCLSLQPHHSTLRSNEDSVRPALDSPPKEAKRTWTADTTLPRRCGCCECAQTMLFALRAGAHGRRISTPTSAPKSHTDYVNAEPKLGLRAPTTARAKTVRGFIMQVEGG